MKLYSYKSSQSVRLLAVLAASLALGSLSYDQGPPGGGGGKDSNPANPLNWQVLTPEYEGIDQRDDWAMVNGVPTHVTGFDVWQDPNDSMGDLDPPAHNETPYSHQVSWSSAGYIRLKMQWIGVGPAPSNVVVKVTSTATGQFWGNGSATADNGLGDASVSLPGPATGKRSTGSELRNAMVQSGVAKVEIFVSAYAEATGLLEAGALATTRQATIELAEKAVTISSSKDPTWRKGPNGTRTLNAVTDVTDVRGDTAVTLFRSPLGLLWGQQSIRYDRALWGEWVSPYNEWWYPYTTPEGFWQSAYDHDTITSEVEWVVQELTFSNQSLIDLVQGNAQSVSTSVTVTNNGGSGTARSAQYTMWVHSPVESPAITSESREYASWIRCSPIYQRNPGDQPMTYTIELSISHSVTVTLSAGGLSMPNLSTSA